MKLSLILAASLISATFFISASSAVNADSELINGVAVVATPEAENLNVEAETGKKRKADTIEPVQEPEEEDWVFNEFFEVFYKYSRARRTQLHKTLMFIRNDDVQGFQDDEENFKKVLGKDYISFRFKDTEPSIYTAMIAFNSENFRREYKNPNNFPLVNDLRAVRLLSRHAPLVAFLRAVHTFVIVSQYNNFCNKEEVARFRKEIIEANPDASFGQKILMHVMIDKHIDEEFVEFLLTTESDLEAFKSITKWPSKSYKISNFLLPLILEHSEFYLLADSDTKIQFIDFVSDLDIEYAQKLIDLDESIHDAVYTLNVDRFGKNIRYTNVLTMSIAKKSTKLFDLVVRRRPESVTIDHVKDILTNIHGPFEYFKTLYVSNICSSSTFPITLEDGSVKEMNLYQICFQFGIINGLDYLVHIKHVDITYRNRNIIMAERVMANLRKFWPSYADLWNHCKTFPEPRSTQLIEFLESSCRVNFQEM